MSGAPSPERVSRLCRHDLGSLMRDPSATRRPELFRRSDGVPILYAGAVHALYGEPGTGKSWVALAAVADVLSHGGRVVVVDYESGPAPVAGRLRALGCNSKLVTQGLVYLRPDGALGLAEVDHLRELVAEGAGLIVVDSQAEALAAAALDENAAGDVTRWSDAVVRPLARDGAAVLIVDHVAKAADGRGRWARGSGAKLAAIDGAAFVLRPGRPFSRRGSGSAELVIGKDREGCIGAVGDVAATVAFEVRHAGDEVRVRLDPPGDGYHVTVAKRHGTSGQVSPLDVARTIGEAGGYWASRRAAADALGLSTNAVGRVLSAAVGAGYLVEEPGANGACAYRLVKHTGDDWAARPSVNDHGGQR